MSWTYTRQLDRMQTFPGFTGPLGSLACKTPIRTMNTTTTVHYDNLAIEQQSTQTLQHTTNTACTRHKLLSGAKGNLSYFIR